MSDYLKPLPALDDRNRPFWDAAGRGELHLQSCLDCGVLRFPATRYCAGCRGERSAWRKVSGRGKVQSFCVFHQVYFEGFRQDVPYNVVVVTLDDGPRLFSNLVGIANDEIRIGMPVEAFFDKATPDVTLVKFQPVA